MAVNGYSFNYTDTATGIPTQFVLGGISEDVAKGIRFGLKKVPSISNVTVDRITETRDNLPAGDPSP